jgi:hypothetical protein
MQTAGYTAEIVEADTVRSYLDPKPFSTMSKFNKTICNVLSTHFAFSLLYSEKKKRIGLREGVVCLSTF